MITAGDLRGIIPPIVTPITSGGAVDPVGLRGVVRWVVDAGVNGVFTLGGTGNFASFGNDERREIARTVVEEVAGQVPVLVGCMDSNTRLVLRHAKVAAEAGADAIVVEPPFYYPCTDEDVLSHYNAVAEASAVPIVVYNVPSANKVHMSLSLIKELADMREVIGIKDSSLDFVLFQELVSAFSDSDFGVLQGMEEVAGPSFLLGASGAILMLANVFPGLCIRLYEAGVSGKVREVRDLQANLMSAFEMFKDYRGDACSNPRYGKVTVSAVLSGLECALDVLGVCKRVTMAPWQAPSAADRQRAQEMIRSLGLSGQ